MTRIDTEIFVMLAEAQDYERTHFEGCYHYHLPCAIKYLAGALDAAQKRLDEYAAEIERLRAENKQPVCNDLDEYYKDEYYKDDSYTLDSSDSIVGSCRPKLDIRYPTGDWEGEAEDEAWKNL